MRLFGTPGGSLDTARATYGFASPFDAAFADAEVRTDVVPQGGIIFDMTGVFALQYNQIMAFPDYLIVTQAQSFNESVNVEVVHILASCRSSAGVQGSPDDPNT